MGVQNLRHLKLPPVAASTRDSAQVTRVKKVHDVRVRSLLWIATTWWLLAAWLPATAGDGDRLADIKAEIREEFPGWG